MGRPQRQFTYTEEQLIAAIAKSKTIYQTIRELGLAGSGAAIKRVRERIQLLKIDTSHFWNREERYMALGHAAGVKRSIPNELVFCENSKISQTHLVRQYKKLGYPYMCIECNSPATYNGKPLVLQLDHRNGIKNDNRKENLRWLCPNCHSQTPTFTNKNIGKVPLELHVKRRNKYLRMTSL